MPYIRTRGKLIVIYGIMFSGKTETFLKRFQLLEECSKKRIICFKPIADTRSEEGFIEGRDGNKRPAFLIDQNNPIEIIRTLREQEAQKGHRFDYIGFDEVQFYPTQGGFFQIVREFLNNGYNIIASGLDFDFKGDPFGLIGSLALLADEQVHGIAYCFKCGKEAAYTQRIIKGEPAHIDSNIIFTDKHTKLKKKEESYEARCEDCYVLPGKKILL
jgi:thymidine kinase